ncbi:zinc finger protein 518B [Engraulis encrasicolus]|uniref:zinc finger protein 518B n=1 Tax=Engraulis encrasicolus TaxID=184585 RepID=UPI002FCF9DBC
MEENAKMESLDSSTDVKGDWCKRLRLRKSTAGLSVSGQADMTDNNSSRQEELSDRKISARPSPKKQRNQRATDTAKRTPTAQCKRSPASSKPKTSTKVHKASLPPPPPPPPPPTATTTAPPADVCDGQPSGPSSPLPTPPQPQLTGNLCGVDLPVPTNGVFTCARCKFHSKDIVAFLQHTHNGTNGLPHDNEVTKDGHARQQSSDLHSYLSLAPPGLPLKYELDSQTPSKQRSYTAKHKATMARIRKGRKYMWRRNKEAQPKVEEEASPELKLFLTKHPLKPNSWMARGFLSVENEILDENGFLLNPEKTIEATNKYLERTTIKEERSGMKFAVKEELENGSHPSTPFARPPPPRNGTSSPSEAINPSNTELARLMEKNNISIPPNCTTQVQGFKMVEGKKHLVLKVVPATKKETADTAESLPSKSPGKSITSDTKTTTMPEEDGDQMDPSSSLSGLQECNGISANGTASSCSSPLGTVADANASPPEKTHVQSDDQGVGDEQHPGCFSLRLSLSPERESVGVNDLETLGDNVVHSTVQETEQPNESPLQSPPAIPVPATEESTCGLLSDSDQAAVAEAQASADAVENDACLSPAVAGAAEVELDPNNCHGGLPVSHSSPSKSKSRPASPPRTQEEEEEEEEGGKDHSSPDDRTSINDKGECHIPESSSTSIKDNRECHNPETSSDADVQSVTVEICGEAEAVKPPPPQPLQNLDHSPLQASCPENSETPAPVSSPGVTAQPNTELSTVTPPSCTRDAVEHPGDPETSALNTEKPEASKRPRYSSPERTEEGATDGPPVPKLSRTLDSQEKGEEEEEVLHAALGGTPHSTLKDAQHTALDSPLKAATHTALEDLPPTALRGATDAASGGTPHTALKGATDSALEGAPHNELGGTSNTASGGGVASTAPSSGEHQDSSARHVDKTLRLFPFSYFQLVTRPDSACQPVVVLNHPDAEVPEVTDIMRVVHKYGTEVQKVRLCAGTLKALDDGHTAQDHEERQQDGDGGGGGGGGVVRCLPGTPLSSGISGVPPLPTSSPSPSPSPGRVERRRSTVKERFLLKMKLRRSGQKTYQVVSPDRRPPQPSLRCWFCGRAFTKQDEFISHEQRHTLDTSGDWSSWLKSP